MMKQSMPWKPARRNKDANICTVSDKWMGEGKGKSLQNCEIIEGTI